MTSFDSKSIIEQLNELWIGKKFIFPGPQPVSIERKHISILKSNKYYIGHKNDGERVAICCIKINETPRCFLVNRKLQLTAINLLLHKKMYNGTILDCEIVDNELIIFDCPLFCGESLKTKQFSERLTYIESFLLGTKARACDKYKLRKKEFVERNSKDKLQKTSHTDGYIFVPQDKPVQTSTHNSYFKWKPFLQNTVDFAIKDSNVYLQNAGKLCKSGVTLENIDAYISDTMVIVECMYVSENIWKVLQIRHDKDIPNSIYTFKKTLVNISENITIEELVS